MKNLKGKFTPRFIQMRNRNGMRFLLKKRAGAIADYLEQQHWQNATEDGKERKIKVGCIRNMTETEEAASRHRQRQPFTFEELEEAIKMTTKGKAPGPGGIRMGLIKWLSKDNRKWLLNTINGWWSRREAPEELYYAKVATMIQTKLATTGQSHYLAASTKST